MSDHSRGELHGDGRITGFDLDAAKTTG